MDTDRVFIAGLKITQHSRNLYFKSATRPTKYAAILNRVFAARKPDTTPNDNLFDNTGISTPATSIGLKLKITDYNPAYTGIPTRRRQRKRKNYLLT